MSYSQWFQKAYVLSIPRLKDRQEKIKDRFRDKLEVEFFEGVDYMDSGLDMSLPYTKRILPHLYIGTSHYMLYRYLLENGGEGPWIILEDDAHPTPYWDGTNWKAVESSLRGLDMIKLFTPEIERGNTFFVRDDILPGIRDTSGFAWIGLCGVILTKVGLEKMMNIPFIYDLVDLIAAKELKWKSLVPNIITAIPGKPSYEI